MRKLQQQQKDLTEGLYFDVKRLIGRLGVLNKIYCVRLLGSRYVSRYFDHLPGEDQLSNWHRTKLLRNYEVK